ncbi:MAG TPA: tRNA lysidine(34) synthetase TilS [Anaerolineaceae bacterium]|nr:tRNA lysidine(34) synthetase TilS [Anaerolineaceae bacterium]
MLQFSGKAGVPNRHLGGKKGHGFSARGYNAGVELTRFEQICRERCRLVPDRPILVGLSGGADSLCLVDLLDRLGFPLVTACLNHGLRPEADQEVTALAALAAGRGWGFVTATADVAGLARRQHLSIEAAARQARYPFLFAAARDCDAQAVAVGHQADDQVETVLLHLLRGSGLEGLAAMRWRSINPDWDPAVPLVRPLLGTWRTAVAAYCAERGLTPFEDATNAAAHFTRNRIRAELLPQLETYNPRIKAALWRLADTLAADADFLTDAAQAALEALQPQSGAGWISLDHAGLAGLGDGLLRQVIRRVVLQACPQLEELDFDAVERTRRYVRQAVPQGRMELGGGAVVFRDGTRLVVSQPDAWLEARDWPRLAPGAVIPLAVPGEMELPGGWCLQAELLSPAGLEQLRPAFGDPYECWLKAAALTGPLALRTWQPGERFAPLGLGGETVTLGDFWTNTGLPVPARANWPLVCCGNQLVWVPGGRPAHFCRLEQAPQAVIHLRLFKTG